MYWQGDYPESIGGDCRRDYEPSLQPHPDLHPADEAKTLIFNCPIKQAPFQAGLSQYDDLAGIQWEWQAVDGVMTKAPFAGAATGANPTDRGKQGTKRSLLT